MHRQMQVSFRRQPNRQVRRVYPVRQVRHRRHRHCQIRVPHRQHFNPILKNMTIGKI